MLPVLVAMLVILALAGLVVLYVAYPHRGQEVPNAPWVGDALRKGVEALPTLHNQRQQDADGHEAVVPAQQHPVRGLAHR